jgi:hypothetical protein
MTGEPVERLSILLPPAANVDQTYLDGWCEGQAYLILNYESDEQFDGAIEAIDHITTLTTEVERLREALRECRRAVAGGRDEPRRTVREIVDEAIEGHARATLKAKP